MPLTVTVEVPPRDRLARLADQPISRSAALSDSPTVSYKRGARPKARTGKRAANLLGSGAAAHLANHVIQGEAVLHAPCLEPINIHRVGQVQRRLGS